MKPLDRSSSLAASRKLARAVSLLSLAGEQLAAARHSSLDRYHRKKLHNFSIGLRELSLPLSRIASRLERGGQQ